MDPNAVSPTSLPLPGICPVCHQPVSPEQYFCANCGQNSTHRRFRRAPDAARHLRVQHHSPDDLFSVITKWPGLTYLRSKDEKVRRVGVIACTLLVLSTVVTIYYVYVWTQDAIQQSVNDINQEMSI